MKYDDPRLRVGAVVACPADRGDPAYTGRIEHVGDPVHNPGMSPYRWVTVRRPGAHASVWSSNRLG